MDNLQIMEADDILNEHVPLSVRFKYILRENGMLKSQIQGLEYENRKLKEELSISDSDKDKIRRAEISSLGLKLKERNETIKQLKRDIWENKGGAPQDLKEENKRLRGFMVYLENKYGFDLSIERKEFLK